MARLARPHHAARPGAEVLGLRESGDVVAGAGIWMLYSGHAALVPPPPPPFERSVRAPIVSWAVPRSFLACLNRFLHVAV